MFGKMKPDNRSKADLFWFLPKEEPFAMFIQIPEINQIFQACRWKNALIGKLKFLWYKDLFPPNKSLGLSLLVWVAGASGKRSGKCHGCGV